MEICAVKAHDIAHGTLILKDRLSLQPTDKRLAIVHRECTWQESVQASAEMQIPQQRSKK
jgi:hypothetical protein